METFARARDSKALAAAEPDRLAAAVRLRPPHAGDGPAIWRLIAECPPLDANSRYCNLLQCDHFAETCVVAESDEGIVGWLSAYRVPSAPEEIFVWQAAVHEDARGAGLGGRMLEALVARPAAQGARRLTATVTESNHASLAMLANFARRRGLDLSRRPKFDRDSHFEGLHDTEIEVSIGPLPAFGNCQKEF